MRRTTLGLLALLLLALPQVAGAQEFARFGAKHRYSAKFLCGFTFGGDSRLGVVGGHYNTVINTQAVKNRTLLAFRATALSSDLEVDLGVPSGFSLVAEFDRDEGRPIVCGTIKQLLGVAGNEGFVEGVVTIYSNKPLSVADVLTGEGENDLSVMQVYEVEGFPTAQTVEPPVLN